MAKIIYSVISDYDEEADLTVRNLFSNSKEKAENTGTNENIRLAFKSLLADFSLMDYRIDCLSGRSMLDAEISICRSDSNDVRKIIKLDNALTPGKCIFIDFENGWNNIHNYPILTFIAPDGETGAVQVMGEILVTDEICVLYPHAVALGRFGDYDDENSQFDINFCGFISRGCPGTEINSLRSRIEMLENKTTPLSTGI